MSSYEHIGPDWDEEEEQTHVQDERKKGCYLCCAKCQGYGHKFMRLLLSREFLKALLYGQLVSLLLSGTAVFSGLLQQQGVNTPTAQSFLNYYLLCLVYTVMLACRARGDEKRRSIGTMLRHDGWKYALLAFVDVEANYLVVKAYQFTTITSVQVLDCLSILVVVLLSRIFLQARYTAVHIAGVAVSVIGLGGLILADVQSGRNKDSGGGTKEWLGDILVACGAIFYGLSNVGQEFVVKKFPRSDFLGMIGLFGSFISGLQLVFLEREELAKVDFSSYKIWLPWLSYVVCLFLIYTCMSLAIQATSATTLNISVLSADFYALLFGLLIFHYQFHALYIVAFILVIIGILVYTSQPTQDRTATNQVSTGTKVTSEINCEISR